MNRQKLLIFIISFFLLQPGLLFSDAGKTILRYKNFRIIYQIEDETRALKIFNILKEIKEKFDIVYNINFESQIEILLPASQSEFNRLVGIETPTWSLALYNPSKRQIIIKRAQWIKGDIIFERDIAHEISHAYFHEKFEDRHLPRWFNEGLAEYLSNQIITLQDGIILSNALFANTIIPLAHIDSVLEFSRSRAQLAYIESLSAINFIQSNYLKSSDRLSEFLDQIKVNGFENALHNLTGMDAIDFELKWFRWLQDKYQWFIVFNVENLIWIALIIVLVGALYGIRYRNRKILRNWEREEAFHDNYSFQYYDLSKPETDSQKNKG